MTGEHDDAPETYEGKLQIDAGGGDIAIADVRLSGFFQPIDGTFRWQGRIQPDERISSLAARVGRKEIRVRVPRGEWTPAKLGEANPWGGYRIAGRGRPPFEVEAVSVESPASAGE